ncbi:MAG: hypothetical protein NZV14_02030 [Bryobacteraceae bacterium]|nr:hypothetical protein [Bryobacteraceae bacterium]MDW8376908.1 hypothetical protein [Bryobacterales bacterium]
MISHPLLAKFAPPYSPEEEKKLQSRSASSLVVERAARSQPELRGLLLAEGPAPSRSVDNRSHEAALRRRIWGKSN